jgi:hypothetical protein
MSPSVTVERRAHTAKYNREVRMEIDEAQNMGLRIDYINYGQAITL